MKLPRRPTGSAGRVAALGLTLATFMITTLGWLVLADLNREAELHREGLGAHEVSSSLHAVRTQVVELRHSARAAALSGTPEDLQLIESRAVELDAELDYLTQALVDAAPLPGFPELNEAARLLVLHAR